MRLWRLFRGKSRPAGREALAAAPDVHVSAHDEGIALLQVSTGRVFLCNGTGARIWRSALAGLSTRDICEEISRDFGVGCDIVEPQTSTVLSQLERRGLVIRKAVCS